MRFTFNNLTTYNYIRGSVCLVCLCLLHWIGVQAVAQPLIRITDVRKALPVTSQAWVLKANPAIEQIGKYQSRFKPLHLDELELRDNRDMVYWFRFEVRNETDQHLYAALTYAGFAIAELYEWKAGQLMLLGKGGMEVSARDLFFRHSYAIMPMQLAKGQQKTYLLRTERLWAKQGPVIIYPEYALLSSTERIDIQHGLLLGCLLTAFLYMFAFYFVSQEIDYLWLAGQIAFTLLGALFSRGLIPGYLDLPEWLSDTAGTNIANSLVGLTSWQFQVNFLKLRVYGTRLIWWGYRAMLLTSFLFLVAAILNIPNIFEVSMLSAVIGYLFLLYSDFVVYRKGYKPALFLLVTHLIPIVFCVFILFQASAIVDGFIDYNVVLFLLLTYTSYAITVGYKVRLYKDEAETIILQQNQKLEKLIVERTLDLQQETNRANLQSERLRMALRELNHRVRNNLAVVSSLLKLQSNNIDPGKMPDAFQESRQRVDAMALIHQQLYQSEEVTTIDVGAFMAKLTRVLGEAYGYNERSLRVEQELDEVVLAVEQAIPLGLLLNEVLTNAFKYGLSQVESPYLQLRLRQETALYVEVWDNGPGLNEEIWQKNRDSFGHRLIEALTHQLDGRYALSGDQGARFQFWLLTTK